jgi:hypothetical protein
MRHAGRTVAALRFASSTRRDLLLEILALRHQLRVLARPDRRFRASDRLLWLILRRLWPRWRDALRAPSQTWRTFLANHLSQFTSISQVTSLYAPHADDVVEESGLTFRPTLLPRDGLYVPDPCAVVAWPASPLRGSLGTHFVQDQFPDGIVIRNTSDRGPPTPGRLGPRTVCARSGDLSLSSSIGPLDERHGQTIECRDARASSTSPGTKRLRLDFGVTCEW